MSIETEIFKRYYPDFDKLCAYGFVKNKNSYVYKLNFWDNQFRADICVDFGGIISGIVYDLENNEEFIPLRIKDSEGSFVGKIREEYKKILINIRDNCFVKNYFVLPQSNRITNMITEKYGDYPEFLWEKFSGSGIFRNPETNKWYCAILDVDRGKIQKGKSGIVEVINLKLEPKDVLNIVNEPNFYPAYHMNKKHWISVILDDSVEDKRIMKLVEISHNFT